MATVRQQLISLSGLSTGTFREHLNAISLTPTLVYNQKLTGVVKASVKLTGKVKQPIRLKGKLTIKKAQP